MADKIVQATAPKISASVPQYEPKAVNLPVPQITVGNAQPVAITTSVENPKISGSVTNMGEDSVPNPLLFKRLNSEYETLDRFSIEYRQRRFDQTTASDLFNRVVDYRRVFQESQTTSDSYKVFFVNKGLVTPLITLDVPVKGFQKPFQDSSTAVDVPRIQTNKQLLSLVTYSEELVKVAYLKAASELVVSADDFRRTVDYKRSFQSIADATDDFYGQSNVDDDQIARVGKTLVNWIASADVRTVFVSSVQASQTTAVDQKSVGLTKPLFSTGTLASQTKLNLGKPLASTGTFVDLARYGVQKQLSSTSVSDDQHTVRALKTLVTQFNSTDVRQANLQKQLASQTSNQDLFSRVWQAQKQFVETVPTTTLISFDTGLVLVQPLSTQEQSAKNSGKLLLTNFVSSDQISNVVDYKRSFLDFVATTDDFFGNANIDDDQTARVEKNLITWLTPVDQHSVSGVKILSTDYAAQEQAELQSTKVLQSLAEYNDTATYKVDKTLNSALAPSDQPAFNTAKPLQNSFASTDTFDRTVTFNRQPVDLVASSDVVAKTSNKNLISPAVFADQVITQTDFKRTLTSISNTTELVAKVSNLVKQELVLLPEQLRKQTAKILATGFLQQDLVQKTPKKVLSSQAVSSDIISFFKFGNRIFSEIATTNDSGVINNQGYFAESYVEPGYAGTNTNFS